MERSPVAPVAHQVEVLPAWTDEQPPLPLLPSVLAERLAGGVWKGDLPARPVRLRLDKDEPAVDALDRARDAASTPVWPGFPWPARSLPS